MKWKYEENEDFKVLEISLSIDAIYVLVVEGRHPAYWLLSVEILRISGGNSRVRLDPLFSFFLLLFLYFFFLDLLVSAEVVGSGPFTPGGEF